MNGDPWHHKKGDQYVVVAPSWVGNERSGFTTIYHVHPALFATRGAAWRFGLRTTLRPGSEPCDDFNVAVLRGGEVVATLWDDSVVDDKPDELVSVREALGEALGIPH
jgi:hypothetical protein